MASKSMENNLRRRLTRRGLALGKSRTRNPVASVYGTFGVFRMTAPGGHWRSRELVAGDPNTGYGLTPDEVERIIEEDE